MYWYGIISITYLSKNKVHMHAPRTLQGVPERFYMELLWREELRFGVQGLEGNFSLGISVYIIYYIILYSYYIFTFTMCMF